MIRPKTDLRSYQDRTSTFLYEHDEALCVIRPGGGKTVSALTAIVELITDGVIRHAIVVAPKRVARITWPDEIAGWEHTRDLRYKVLTGPPTQRIKDLAGYTNRHLTIVGIDILPWLMEELANYPETSGLFDLIVIDEISRLRNPKGVRFKTMASVAGEWKMIWGMSGTLRPTSALDLFAPARIVSRGKLWGKSYYKWQKTHFYPTDYAQFNWEPFPGHEAVLNAEIAPMITTLAEEDMPQLPEMTVILDRVELTGTARSHYKSMEKKLIATLKKDEHIIADSRAIATGKLAQMASGFIYDEDGTAVRLHEEKSNWLADIIEDNIEPMILVYEYLEDLAMMRRVLGSDLPVLGAGVKDDEAAKIIKDWNAGKIPHLAIHPASAGHGLNLQDGGALMCFLNPTWDSEAYEQTIARLHRSGQKFPVIIRICVATDTVDEMKIMRVHDKMTAQQAFEKYISAKMHLKVDNVQDNIEGVY